MSQSMVRYGHDHRASPDPSVAALLSFVIPGVGQLYNGKFLRAIFWLIVTPGLWLGTGGFLGWICHVIAAYTAYRYAKSHR
jgi:TM2 domain-containing membrane protein YozV